MRRVILMAGVLLVSSACVGGDTTSDIVSTIDVDATTVAEQPTTTAIDTTTSSLATTTTGQATTTITQLDGTWASQPLISYDGWGGIALGWWDGASWVQVEADTELPVAGGEDYQVVLLGSEAVLKGGAPENRGCDVILPEGLPGVLFDDDQALSTVVDDGRGGERPLSGVAISAPWDLRPRPVEAGEAHSDLETLAAELLNDRGFEAESAVVVQITDADLDGDGAIESLVVAEDTELANEASGVYSMVFVVSPSWDEALITAESVISPDQSGFPASFRVSGVADLSGDGTMEVVLDGNAWENGWVTVYELTEPGFEDRISGGCGV